MTSTIDRAQIDSVIAGGKAIRVELNSSEAALLLAFLERLYAWNRFGGFTRISRQDAVRLHLLDSLTLVPDLAGAATVVDLGTGGGVPGIPLAIALGSVHFTLVESRSRRCSFLRETVRDLGLTGHVDVREGDANELADETRRFDAVIARAFLPPRELLLIGTRLISATGRVVVMASNDEWMRRDSSNTLLTETQLSLRSERGVKLPGGPERRRIFRFERTR